MTYAEAIQFLYSLQVFGAHFGLDRALRLAQRLGNPQNELRFIHVAGTNGKGSTCAMLESIYRTSGLRVGLYTSPHLVSFRERIQVNRELISQDDVVRLVAAAKELMAEFSSDDHPTFFEIVTIMALRYFAERECELVIWETGLGGRLDATNIVTPLASVITNVQFDHEKWLGDTLEKIAREKAGIIKPRVPVITAAEQPAALRIIRETAENLLAPLHVVEDAPVQNCEELFSHRPSRRGLIGEHQRVNAAVALKTVEVLNGVMPVDSGQQRAALDHVNWPGRFQIIQRPQQTLVLDGAHNPAGARALISALQAEFPGRAATFIVGVLEDKNWAAVCDLFATVAARLVVVPVASKRSAQPRALADACRAANPRRLVTEKESLRSAMQETANDSIVVITGSLYLVGEALELLELMPAAGERGLNEWTETPR